MKKRFLLLTIMALTAAMSALADDYIRVSNREMSFTESWKKAYTYFNDTSPCDDNAYASNAPDIEKAYVQWDATNRKLTLKNIGMYRGNFEYLAINSYLICLEINSKKDVTIEVLGKNYLSTQRGQSFALHGNTTLIGDGTLDLRNKDDKKPSIDLCEENLTLTLNGPSICAIAYYNVSIRSRNSTGTLHMKSGTLSGGGNWFRKDYPLMKEMGNVIFDYGMGVQHPHGVAFNPARHTLTYIGTDRELLLGLTTHTVLGPIKYYGFSICGKEITENNYNRINHYFGVTEGRVHFSPESNRLYMDDATIYSQTTSPTIENHSNDGLAIMLDGENKLQFYASQERKALYLKKNTTIDGYGEGALVVESQDNGIYVASNCNLTLKNVTLSVPYLAGGNASSALCFDNNVKVQAKGNSKGTVRQLKIVNMSYEPDVAVASSLTKPRFIWNREGNSMSGIYENPTHIATGEVEMRTDNAVEWLPVYICGYQVNSLNGSNCVNEYVKSGSLSFDGTNNHLTMTNVSIDYDKQEASKAAIHWEGSSQNKIFFLMLKGNNTIKNSNHPEAIRSKGDLQIHRSESDEATLTLTGTNANVYAYSLLGLVNVTAKMSSVKAEALGIMSSNLSITQKLEVESCELTGVKVASTPNAPAYYDSQTKTIVAPEGAVNIVRSSNVTVYDGIQFCGEEINSANAPCLMNKYVEDGSVEVKKMSDGYQVHLHDVSVNNDSSSPVFEFGNIDGASFFLYGDNNFNSVTNPFIFGKAKLFTLRGESSGEEVSLMVNGNVSSRNYGGAIVVPADGKLSIYKNLASKLNVSVPCIAGQGTSSTLYVYDPYLNVTGNRSGSPAGTVSNIKCELSSRAELYNTSSTPREIKSDGIYSNGSLCTEEVKFVGKGESYIPVTDVKITPTRLTLTKRGETQTLSATVLPADATNKKVSWTTQDDSIVSVDQNGKVKALQRGTTYVYAVPAGANNNSIVGSCIVTVDIPQPTGITLDQTEVLIDRESTGGIYLTASLTPSNAETDFEWESSDPTLVSVLRTSGQTALVRRVGDEGTATITVKTANGLSASCEVTVHYPITPMFVEFEQRVYTLTEAGQQLKLVPIVKPANCEKLSFTWYTSSDAISLSDDGTVTALRNGSQAVECWACYDGQKWAPGEVRINVEIPPTPVIATGLKLKAAHSIFHSLGEAFIITPVFTPENVTNQELAWDTTDASVATVDQDGFVTVVGWGDCYITATTTDGSRIKATYSIMVIDPSTIPDPIYATGIRLDENEITLMKGEETRIALTIEPADYNQSVMIEPMEGDISIAQVDAQWDWNTNRTCIYIRTEEWSEMSGDLKVRVRPNMVDWDKLGAMGIWMEPADTLTIHVLAPIIFAEASPEDINITYHVTDVNEKICEVYTQTRPGSTMIDPLDSELIPAVNQTATGKLTIPARANGYWVTHVMPCAFNRCSGLTEIEFSEGIESIGDYACYSALFSLERVTLPSTITELGYSCFSANPSDYATSEDPSGRNFIREVNIKSFMPPTGQNGSDINWTGAFQSVAADAVLYVPTGALANYNVQPWTEWFSRIEEKQFFEDPDGIASPKSSPEGKDFNWFDLSGRKLGSKPAKPGLYIQNGKKIVIK